VLCHIITVTLKTWEEKQFYVGEATWPKIRELSQRMRHTENGIRAILRTIEVTDEIEFWYRCGLRGLNIQPPYKHAHSFNLGKRMAKMKGNG
jgi:hypothetical protein